MQTTKIFLMAALALMTAACSNDDTNILTPAEQPAKAEGIPFTATISMGESASTRALTEDTENKKIVATWATGEKVALIYDVSGTHTKTDAEVTKQADGTATISATLASGATNGSDVTIIYPATAADGTTGNVLANLLAAQDGTLATIATNYEVRKGTGKLSINAGGATVNNGTAGTTVTLTNLNAIFKFTLQDLSAAAKNATEFKVSDNSGNVITTVTLGSASGVLYVALPVMATGTYWFNATIDSKPYIAKATTAAATVAGKYYQTTVKMATIGDYLNKDGSITATKQASGDNESYAVIAYVGSAANYFSHFLALALTDVDANYHTWTQALTAVGTYAAAHPVTIGSTTYETSTTGATYYDQVASNQSASSATATDIQTGWRLPSVTDWRYVFDGLGRIKGGLNLSDGTNAVTPTSPLGVSDFMVYRDGDNGSTLRAAINTACGNDALQSNYYWSSSKYTDNSDLAWDYYFYNGIFYPSNSYFYVRAVFAY